MTPRTWWLGVGAIAAAIVLHAFVPRYELQQLPTAAASVAYVRVDRWTGRAQLERYDRRALTPVPSLAEDLAAARR